MQLIMPGVQLHSTTSPLRYFGGKSRGLQKIMQFIPANVTELVSPFIGGGSLELALTARGIQVHAYDLLKPLVNLWQWLLTDPRQLETRIREAVLYAEKNDIALQDYVRIDATDDLDDAHRFFIRLNCSFNGNLRSGFSSYTIQSNGDIVMLNYPNKKLIRCNTIGEFNCPLLSVDYADFRESLAKHPDSFAYCDPPYPEASAGYGTSARFHEDFPHQDLAEILHKRKTPWMLSYNNCDTVKQLYPPAEFRYDFPKWCLPSKKQSKTENCNEVIIRPKGQPPIRI